MLVKLLVYFCLMAATMIGVSYLIPGIKVKSFWTALVAAIVLGLINATIGRFIMFLTGPFRLLTLGLLTIVINGFILKFTAGLIDGFDVKGWVDAILGALLLGIAGGVMHAIVFSM
jgi:putative membrane protein